MKNIAVLYLALILLGFCMISHASNIAYIHGDVSEAGFTPSSSATTGATTPYDQMLLTDTGNLGVSIFASDVRAQGHSIDQYYDQATVLNDAFLSDKDVIVFGLHQKQWSSTEQTALDAWLNDGGGMLIYSDSASGGFHRLVGAQNDVGQRASNSLIAPYGIEIMVDQANGAPTIMASSTASVTGLRGLELMGEGVSPIAFDSSDSNVEVLVPYTGPIRTNQGISFDDPVYAALALRRVGQGNIIALFDRQPIWNNGNGANIQDADNRVIFTTVINFLASRDDDPEPEPEPSQDSFDVLLVPAIIAARNSQDKPGPSNTGPTNENALVDSDSIRVRRGWQGGGAGTEQDPYIVENVNVSGSIRVEVPHVIVRNFRASADALYVVQTNYDGVYNVLIEDGEVIGGRTNTSAPIIVRDGVTLRRLEIHESGGDGVKVQGSNFTMENCWVYDLGAKERAHADGVQGTINSGRWSNHVNRNNFFDMAVDELVAPYKSNATIFLHTGTRAESGSGIDNVIIENNWLIGGNFSLPLAGDMSDVVVRNNQFGRVDHEVRFGHILIDTDDKLVTGNTIEDTGELVPNQ